MKKRMVLICIALMLLGLSVQAETQYSKLSPVWEKVLLNDTEGEWSVKHHEESVYNGRIEAVSNNGCMFFCDAHNNRILVFSDEGDKMDIINLREWIHFPSYIYIAT